MRQIIDIPADRNVHFDVTLPETVPCGRREVILDFPQETNIPDPTEATTGTVPSQPGYDTLEQALAEAARRREAAKANPSLNSLKAWHGILKDSKVWGAHLNTNAIIREMRDEWTDPWDSNPLDSNPLDNNSLGDTDAR